MKYVFLVLAINTANSSSIVVMPEKYEVVQCQNIADNFKWPWDAKCVEVPNHSIQKCSSFAGGTICLP